MAAALVYLALLILAAEPGRFKLELTRKLGEELDETTEGVAETDLC